MRYRPLANTGMAISAISHHLNDNAQRRAQRLDSRWSTPALENGINAYRSQPACHPQPDRRLRRGDPRRRPQPAVHRLAVRLGRRPPMARWRATSRPRGSPPRSPASSRARALSISTPRILDDPSSDRAVAGRARGDEAAEGGRADPHAGRLRQRRGDRRLHLHRRVRPAGDAVPPAVGLEGAAAG